MPIGPAINYLFAEPPMINAVAHVTDASRMAEAKEQIRAYLRSRHAIMPDGEGNYADDFELTTKQDLLGAQLEAARTFSTLLTAMAIVSLSVGGIGIMNVMLVSITERTREIGVRMAIGARRKDVVSQFLLGGHAAQRRQRRAGHRPGRAGDPPCRLAKPGQCPPRPDQYPAVVWRGPGHRPDFWPVSRAARRPPRPHRSAALRIKTSPFRSKIYLHTTPTIPEPRMPPAVML